MAWLHQLRVNGLRNIEQASLGEFGRFNIIYGENGAGKTSLLEAIHLLGLARSFRGTKSKPLINREANSCIVFGGCSQGPIGASERPETAIGVSKEAGSQTLIKVNSEIVQSAAELANALPLQVLNADSFQLLMGSPKIRRQYIDWGVFHVEHGFLAQWRSFQKVLKQRNSLLRRGKINGQEMAPWDQEYQRLSACISKMRLAYMEALEPYIHGAIKRLWPEVEGLAFSYYQGWDTERSAAEALDRARSRDIQAGHSTVGPHRADLRIRYQGQAVSDVLSRGQLKVLAAALRVAQAALLKTQSGEQCLFLVDDLPAELDRGRRKALIQLLGELGSQVFITCIDKKDLDDCGLRGFQTEMFHVEQGKVGHDAALM